MLAPDSSYDPAPVSGSADALAMLKANRVAWDGRPALRRLYTDWFGLIADRLATVGGSTVELGAGFGAFKEFRPETVSTDVLETPWTDAVVSAEDLPFADGELANLVMLDVFHHIARPRQALAEAQRSLAPGGRLVMVEPYCSPLSTFAYRHLHDEHLDLTADPERPQPPSSATDPFDANIALPTILFWRRPEVLARWVPALRITERRRLSWLAYPLSGGFSRRPLVPTGLAPFARRLDRALAPAMAPLAGFRCLVVLERA